MTVVGGGSSSPSSMRKQTGKGVSLKTGRRRLHASHIPKWQRFKAPLLLQGNNNNTAGGGGRQATATMNQSLQPYQRQFSHVYHTRLNHLKDRCWQQQQQDTSCESSSYKKVARLLELQEDVLSWVVGTLIVVRSGEEMDNGTKCKSLDEIFLEDESGRVALSLTTCGEVVHQYCTGIVMGVQGKLNAKGILVVDHFLPPALLPPVVSSGVNDVDDDSEQQPHLVLVSGLQCGNASVSPLTRNMLLSYLQGRFTDDAHKVARMIVAGGNLCPPKSQMMIGLQELDAFLCQTVIATGVPVDILPGKDDPTTANWPQRPLLGALLQHSTRLLDRKGRAGNSSLFFRTPNPYAALHANKMVVGTDGANIADLTVNLLNDSSNCISELEAMRKSLEWNHICPTGPDSVPTMPHTEQDPMVLSEAPHIYFAGNCTKFATAMCANSRLICIPKFSETGEAVLVNLKTLDVELLRFTEPQ